MGFCGDGAEKQYALLSKKEWIEGDVEGLKTFFQTFEGMMAYLTSIATFLKKDTFDDEVIRAYLIGWDGWAHFDSRLLKKELRKVSILKQVSKVESLPAGLPFTHNFHVLYFGSLARDLPGIHKLSDACKISLGKIIKGGRVKYNKLLPDLSVVEAIVDVTFEPFEASVGDFVFFHYRRVFGTATPDDMVIYEDNFNQVLTFMKSLQLLKK
ncbi:MAG: hypothetical protein GOV00_03390 [Candidatus Altiarchaeota archaeon]|nr:hypothetical protein [Candidatus Altiarchaeota archaeon]